MEVNGRTPSRFAASSVTSCSTFAMPGCYPKEVAGHPRLAWIADFARIRVCQGILHIRFLAGLECLPDRICKILYQDPKGGGMYGSLIKITSPTLYRGRTRRRRARRSARLPSGRMKLAARIEQIIVWLRGLSADGVSVLCRAATSRRNSSRKPMLFISSLSVKMFDDFVFGSFVAQLLRCYCCHPFSPDARWPAASEP